MIYNKFYCLGIVKVLSLLSRGVKNVKVSIHDTLAVLINVQLIYCYENKRGLMLSNFSDL